MHQIAKEDTTERLRDDVVGVVSTPMHTGTNGARERKGFGLRIQGLARRVRTLVCARHYAPGIRRSPAKAGDRSPPAACAAADQGLIRLR